MLHVPVPAPVQQGAGLPAPTHWAFVVSSPGSRRPLAFASSFGPEIMVICPAVAPPEPRLTRTLQVPTGSCESDGLPSPLRSAVRWIASTGFLLSPASGEPDVRGWLHWPSFTLLM